MEKTVAMPLSPALFINPRGLLLCRFIDSFRGKLFCFTILGDSLMKYLNVWELIFSNM